MVIQFTLCKRQMQNAILDGAELMLMPIGIFILWLVVAIATSRAGLASDNSTRKNSGVGVAAVLEAKGNEKKKIAFAQLRRNGVGVGAVRKS